ncbi:4144_t:CDS:2, partial [Acaulospora colombiana]
MTSQDTNLTIEPEPTFENEQTAHNSPSKMFKFKEKILTSIRDPKTVMKIFFSVILLIVGNAVLFMSLNWVSLRNKKETALGIEIGTQIVTAILVLLALLSLRATIAPFIRLILMFFKRDESTRAATINSIKKHIKWFDPEHDSLVLLFLALFFSNLATIAQGAMAYFMWNFSAYDKDDNIILKMITPTKRPGAIFFGVT